MKAISGIALLCLVMFGGPAKAQMSQAETIKFIETFVKEHSGCTDSYFGVREFSIDVTTSTIRAVENRKQEKYERETTETQTMPIERMDTGAVGGRRDSSSCGVITLKCDYRTNNTGSRECVSIRSIEKTEGRPSRESSRTNSQLRLWLAADYDDLRELSQALHHLKSFNKKPQSQN